MRNLYKLVRQIKLYLRYIYICIIYFLECRKKHQPTCVIFTDLYGKLSYISDMYYLFPRMLTDALAFAYASYKILAFACSKRTQQDSHGSLFVVYAGRNNKLWKMRIWRLLSLEIYICVRSRILRTTEHLTSARPEQRNFNLLTSSWSSKWCDFESRYVIHLLGRRFHHFKYFR